ncbi:MAG: hypothetical protein WCE62_01890 [Polyangiales bacterium]
MRGAQTKSTHRTTGPRCSAPLRVVVFFFGARAVGGAARADRRAGRRDRWGRSRATGRASWGRLEGRRRDPPASAEVQGRLTEGYELEFRDTDDWIEIKTGEWLRGDLRSLRPKGLEAGSNLELYSKNLDDLTFSWGDIVGIHSPKTKSYTFKGKIAVAGKAMLTREQVIIGTEDGVKSYPRSDLLAIYEARARERTW